MSHQISNILKLWSKGFYVLIALSVFAIVYFIASKSGFASSVVDTFVLIFFAYLSVGIYVLVPCFIWAQERDWLRLSLWFIITIPVGIGIYLTQ